MSPVERRCEDEAKIKRDRRRGSVAGFSYFGVSALAYLVNRGRDLPLMMARKLDT